MTHGLGVVTGAVISPSAMWPRKWPLKMACCHNFSTKNTTQVIQVVTFLSPNVGWWSLNNLWTGNVFTIPNRSRIESPDTKTLLPIKNLHFTIFCRFRKRPSTHQKSYISHEHLTNECYFSLVAAWKKWASQYKKITSSLDMDAIKDDSRFGVREKHGIKHENKHHREFFSVGVLLP